MRAYDKPKKYGTNRVCRCCSYSRDKVSKKAQKHSARQANKSIAVSEYEEWLEGYSPDIIRNLRYNMKYAQGNECYDQQEYGPAARLGHVLEALGIGKFDLHKCTCIDVTTLTDQEVLEYWGYANRIERTA